MKEKVLIVGAGGAGKELLAILKTDEVLKELYEIIGFVDDDKTKIGTSIDGLPVLGQVEELSYLLQKHPITTVFIAIPSGNGILVRRIVNKCKFAKVKIKIIPRISEIVNGLVTLDQVRDIQVEDILGRAIVRQDFAEAKEKMVGKVVIVFGAAGSIGSELATQILSLHPKRLIVVDWWENGMFELGYRLNEAKQNLEEESNTEIIYKIHNIQEKDKIDALFKEYTPDIVFNAAAYKHVPLMEDNPAAAVLNNIQGTKNLFELSIKHQTKSFILISSDKAVNPTNVMGATKRATEKLMHYYAKKSKNTSFLAVRFGNVLNSNGSVIPTFKKQIERGLVTVTHKDIVRYFMTIDEAAQLVLQCWVQGKTDQIFVLDMGEPIKIMDLAHDMIRLAGKEPGKDVKIKIIGLRPGEKLYEELLTKIEETSSTKNEKIFILNKDESFGEEEFIKGVEDLITLAQKNHNKEEIITLLQKLIPTYKRLDKNE